MKIKLLLIVLLIITLSACSRSNVGLDFTPTAQLHEAGKGAIVGELIRKDTQPEIPYIGLKVFLGTLIKSNDGTTSLGRVDPNTAPISITDQTGRFEFENIEPGKYILVVEVPPNYLIKLKNPETGDEMMLDAEADKTTDLGKLIYNFPFDTGTAP